MLDPPTRPSLMSSRPSARPSTRPSARPSAPAPAMLGTVSALSDEGRAFLQDRLGLFGKISMLLSGGFYLLVNTLFSILSPEHPFFDSFANPSSQIHLATAAASGLVWLICARAHVPARGLGAIDLAGTVTLCVGYTAMIIPGSAMESRPELIALLAITNILIARAVIVPGSPARTAFVSGCASIAPIAATWFLYSRGLPQNADAPASLYVVVAFSWCLAAVGTAAVASHVIYGLRKIMDEAKQLGQYTLEEPIGEGGMGIVYRASHAMLRRPTAVKLLPADKGGEQQLARFEREVQLTSRLTHPNTIQIFDYGRTPDGVFYYAMELLDGLTVEELVAEDGPQPAGRVAHLLKQVCGALSEAHGIGLIHRDIKPANIFLCERGGVADVAKVLDFGLVKELGGDGVDPALSSTETIAGTPLFMAPEAIASPADVDQRTDLYSLGAVAYFLLTGEHVFGGATLIAVCGHHLHSEPEPPSKRLGQPIPPKLEAIVLRCLAKRPEDRYADARALAHAIAEADDVAPWLESDAAHWWSSHRHRTGGQRVSSKSGVMARAPTIQVDLANRIAKR